MTIAGRSAYFGEVLPWIATIPYLLLLQYMYVDDISVKKTGKKTFQAVATITIKEVGGGAVKDAVVHAHWSGMTSGVVSWVTNKKGKVSFASDRVKGNRTFTITVDQVVKHEWKYDLDSSNKTSDST